MERILKGSGHTLTATFTVDGTPTDPDPATATVEVLNADGTVLVAAGTNAPRLGAGKFGHTLTPAQTATRRDLVARWTATIDGVVQTLETEAEIITRQARAIRDDLAELCAAADAPTLSTDELWDLVRLSRRDDVEERTPADPEWVETYERHAGAAEGWRRKAGKAAPLYSFSIDGQRSDQSHLYQHCLSHAEHYAALISNFLRLR